MTANKDRKDDSPPGQTHHHVEDGRFEARKRRSEGIVRDEPGKAQPADKERAQRESKTK